MMLRHLGSNAVHLSMLDYPRREAHFIKGYESPRVEEPHARCGVVLNNRRAEVVIMQDSTVVTCRACRRLAERDVEAQRHVAN